MKPTNIMKPTTCSLMQRNLRVAAALALGAGLAAQAGTLLQWDINSGSAGAQLGAGNWDTSTANWWTGSGNVTWNNANNDTAQFNGTGGPNNYNVTITEPITIGGIQTTVSGYGSATIAASGTGALNLGLNSTTISNGYIVGWGLTISAPITGLGAVFSGGSAITLSGSNTFTGAAVVNNNLTISHYNALGDPSIATTINSNATLYLNNTLPSGTFPESLILNGGILSDGSANAVVASGLITMQSNSTIQTPNIGGRNLTIMGGITNTGGNLILQTLGSSDVLTVNTKPISGTGTITVAAGNIKFGGTNTFSGSLAVAGGRLTIDNNCAIQNANTYVTTGATLVVNVAAPVSPSLVLNGGTLYDGLSGVQPCSGPPSLTANSTIELWGAGRAFTLGNGATVSLGTSTLLLKGGNNGTDNGFTLNSKITGNGGIMLTNNNTSLMFGSGGSDYTGPTIVDATAYRILLSAENAMSSNSDVIVNRVTAATDGGLNLYNHSAIIGALAGTGSVFVGNNGGTRTLTLGANNHSATFSGALNGPGNVIKTGEGSQFFNGSNTLTGATTVMNGFIGGNGFLSGNLVLSGGGGFAAQAGSTLKIKGNIDLSTLTDTLVLVGAKPQGRNTIITYTGNRSGTFDLVTEVKVDYSVPGEIAILPLMPGTVMTVR